MGKRKEKKEIHRSEEAVWGGGRRCEDGSWSVATCKFGFAQMLSTP